MQSYDTFFKMQTILKKKHRLFFILPVFWVFGLGIFPLYAQMDKADTLFNKKKYLESLKLYDAVLKEKREATPNMLLKMAFIYEGLKDYTNTLYCLSLYYQHAPNDKTLVKMENIALEYRLKGYGYSDFDFLRAIYFSYFPLFTVLLLLVCFLLFSIVISRNRTRKYVPARYGLVFMTILVIVVYLLNFTNTTERGIIAKDNSLVMSAASAGSDLIDVIEKGHRVEVLGKRDIWYEIKWDNERAFILENNLMLIDI